MCQPSNSQSLRGEVAADSNNYKNILVLPWMPLFGGTTLRVVDEIRDISGNLVTVVRYRMAPVLQRLPSGSGWTNAASTRSANGIGVQDISLSSGTTTNMWIQVALACKASTGAAEGTAMVQASLNAEGKVVANRTLTIQPEVNASQDMYIPLCDPFPAVGFSSFMFATMLFGMSGKITYQPAFRTFAADTIIPDAWSTTGMASARTDVTADEAVNWGTDSPTLGTKMYVQPGLKISSSDSTVRCQIQAIVAAKW